MTESAWTDPAFVDAAHDWIDARLVGLGLTRSGVVEQPHVTAWGTVMRVPTSDGQVWFKAMEERLAFEGPLLELIAPTAPDWLQAPLAHDPATGWLLLADAGERLREVIPGERSLVRWLGVLDATARIQVASIPLVDDLLAVGVPDMRLAVLPELYGELLGRLEGVDPRLPDVDAVREMCTELASYGIPETVQHDDLHDGQVFVSGAQHLVLDWGDACIGHPFFTLSVTLEGVISWGVDDEEGSEDLAPYLEAYLGPWREHVGPEVDAAVPLALRLGWACRAVNGHVPSDPASTHTRLKMFLDGKP